MVARDLQRECGVTRISLDNAAILSQWHGTPRSIALVFERDNPEADYDREPEAHVRVTWDDGTIVHTFTGFAWGYGGEGPRGLRQWLDSVGAGEGIKLSALRYPGDVPHMVAHWTPQSGWAFAESPDSAYVTLDQPEHGDGGGS